jgi:hypothetical protein
MDDQANPLIARVSSKAEETEFFLRIGMAASANEKLRELIDLLLSALTLFDLSQVPLINDLFKRMLSSQEREDWIALADILQYELIPTLHANGQSK